ncbi:Nucleotide-binding universal stress protein, UspA family [Halorientalis persicus]|uniref:Nucleotide-binding universal stress protein, UspA family n=1 Tax=Halorientalis persicus TaxID=1367881 RepID=A0A1H8DDX3_9EURY|nr:universal stress protein [Halorientalis persicus]SEN05366.1 Nucleotide-binding universal stress protein, UspA family [Halorientalis persicus]
MTDIFERVLLPVASTEDGRTTAQAFAPYAADSDHVVAVNVIEKAGGAPDKASVEQREQEAEKIFAIVQEELGDGIETEIAYGTDVAETIFEVADEMEATAIVFTPRGGSRWVQLLTGDVALDLITETDRPVIVLPDDDTATDGGDE